MRRFLLRAGGGLAAALAGAGVAFLIVGPEQVWREIGGPADQGKVDFDALTRSSSDNDALAATAGTPAGEAEIVLPLYEEEPDMLMNRLDAVLLGRSFSEKARRVDDRTDPAYRRYVVRTPVLRFPDTLDARALPVEGGTALMLYSRALLGRSDLGKNAKRLRRIARRLFAQELATR